MKDRYLFRGKRTDNGEWVIGSYIPKWYDGARISQVIVQDENSDDLGLLDEPLVKYYIQSKTIGQCTGLKDKNGKLIFEGDVVDRNGYRGVIEYNDHYEAGACFVVNFDDEDAQDLWDYKLRWYELEIIGNIHEAKK